MTTKFYFETKDQYLAFREKWRYAARHGFPLTAAHYMLYNIIRGRHPQTGFTPFRRRSKIEGMGIINRGVYMAYEELRRLQSDANRYETSKWSKSQVNDFLKPFGDTFTHKDLAKIEIPSVEPLDSNYGKGRRLAEKILEGECISNVRSCVELMEIYDSLETPVLKSNTPEAKAREGWRDAMKRAFWRGVKVIDKGAA